MKKIFFSIGKGILNGFPMIQSIIQNVKNAKGEKVIPVDSNKPIVKKEFDVISLVTELAIVALIAAFVFGKITFEDLEKLIGIVK